jgi:hypothetical protein
VCQAVAGSGVIMRTPRKRVPSSAGSDGSKGVSGVRVLAGTRKGAFVLTSDGTRKQWEVSGPHFAGWEVYHVKGSPAPATSP